MGPSSDAPTTDGIVVHLDEPGPDKHASVLQNISNLVKELGDRTTVELVVHGPGLDAVLRTASTAEDDKLTTVMDLGIGIVACANTMRARDLHESDLHDGVGVVPSGIAHLVRRQRQGWSYLRP